MYFDIEGCSFRPGRGNYPLNNAFLKTLMVQERIRGSVRIFLKATAGVSQKTFVLPKNPSKPDRVVIFLTEPAQALQARRDEELAEVRRLRASNIKIVVLDPGHGGEDPGARHNGIIEKDYVLGMSKLIKAYFDRDPKYRAILTRSGDFIIPLARRRQIAEHLGADVFLAVHANYNRKKAISGIEIYYESPRGAVGEAERVVADLENDQDSIGGVDVSVPSNLSKTQIIQMQASAMFKSNQLCERLGNRLAVAVPGLPFRGVKRAGFKVLHSLSLPSALLELGYTSNNTDAWYLKNQQAQQRLAQAVYLGIRDFLEGEVPAGTDVGYLNYIQQVEQEKRIRAERARIAREKRAQALANSRAYRVKKGETVASVAGRFKVSAASLRDLNQFSKKRKLKAGEVIRIPGK